MIQLQVLNKILQDKDPSLIVLNNLNADYFSSYKNEFLFIQNHLNQYNQIPDAETFLSNFPDFDIREVRENESYLMEELTKDYNTRYLANSFNNIRELLMANKVEEAMQLYKNAYENMKSGVSLQSVDIVRDTSRYDAYVERLDDFNKYYITTGFPELDQVVGGWDREEELATIVARTNMAKCLAKGTRVMMADGTTKAVEDVRVGDRVQSLNRINNVLALHNGTSKGYKIIPTSGEPFVVSENHMLTLMQRVEYWDKERKVSTTRNEYKLVDMFIEDYLALSKHKQRNLRLYRPSIEYNTKEQLIPAYILGAWLGDGTSCRVELTTADEEIKQEWFNFAKANGATINDRTKVNCKAHQYDITYGESNRGCNNKLMSAFKYYNLLNNKHIPLEYLTGDRQQRLELLAGIIDSDGIKQDNTFCITQKSLTLINDIVKLARGLGIRVSSVCSRCGSYTKCVNDKLVKVNLNTPYYKIQLSGSALLDVPVKLHRKQISSSAGCLNRKLSLCGFKVEPIDEIEYYGFMCDGDSRYLLADNTLTHNTWVLLKCASAAVKKGMNVGLYSGEMSERKVGYRFDTLVGHIANGSLIHGNINVQNDYKKYISELPNKFGNGSLKVLTPKMINGPAGVSALRAFIEKEKLDILFIDQHSLLEDDRKARNPVEKAANISKDLKNLQVMCRIPIISVSQQNRSSTENGVDTTMIAQSDRIGQDSTLILFLEKKQEMLKMYIVKSRDSENGKVLTYKTDLNNGHFYFVPEGDSDIQVDEDYEHRYDRVENDGEDVF